jgi:hypothetical protein
VVWWFFLREERKEAASRRNAQEQLIADFMADDATRLDDPSIAETVLRIGRACVREQLAVPESANFSDEVVKRPPNGHYLAIGRVDSTNDFGRRTTNWYVFACAPTMHPTFTELLESDPRALQ